MVRRAQFRPFLALGVIPLLLGVVGCNNIWEWTVDDESYDAQMAAGRDFLSEGAYAMAEESFAEAVDMRPESAEARYYLAKAAVLHGEVDVFSLVQELTGTDGGAERVFAYGTRTANSIYRVNRVVLDSLEPIRTGEASEGRWAFADVDLDLAVAYTLRGILRLRDTNGDGVIDDLDVSLDDIGFGEDENGEWSLDGVQDIPPEDLNDMIEDLNDLVEDGGDVLGDVLGDDTGIDLDDLGDLLDDLGTDISAFYVNTGAPGNPGEGDNDLDGLIDEECLNGVDDDGDGLVDEDTRILGCPPPSS